MSLIVHQFHVSTFTDFHVSHFYFSSSVSCFRFYCSLCSPVSCFHIYWVSRFHFYSYFSSTEFHVSTSTFLNVHQLLVFTSTEMPFHSPHFAKSSWFFFYLAKSSEFILKQTPFCFLLPWFKKSTFFSLHFSGLDKSKLISQSWIFISVVFFCFFSYLTLALFLSFSLQVVYIYFLTSDRVYFLYISSSLALSVSFPLYALLNYAPVLDLTNSTFFVFLVSGNRHLFISLFRHFLFLVILQLSFVLSFFLLSSIMYLMFDYDILNHFLFDPLFRVSHPSKGSSLIHLFLSWMANAYL